MTQSVDQTSLPATEPPSGTGGASTEGGTTERLVRRAEVDAKTKDARRARMAEAAARTARHIAELRAADARRESWETMWRQLLHKAP